MLVLQDTQARFQALTVLCVLCNFFTIINMMIIIINVSQLKECIDDTKHYIDFVTCVTCTLLGALFHAVYTQWGVVTCWSGSQRPGKGLIIIWHILFVVKTGFETSAWCLLHQEMTSTTTTCGDNKSANFVHGGILVDLCLQVAFQFPAQIYVAHSNNE